MTTRLTLDEAQARVRQARAGDSSPLSPDEPARPVAVPSLPTCLDIAERLIEDAADLSNKWPLGVHDIDDALGGGLKKRECMIVAGKAHTGKTVLIINAVARNPNNLVMWMTPDEPDLMVLSRILSIRLNKSPRVVYDLARKGDEQILNAIRHQSETDLRNLRIVDRAAFSKYGEQMRRSGHHVEGPIDVADHILGEWTPAEYGRPADVFIWDFASQLDDPELGDDPSRISALKSLGMRHDAVTIIVHQASRGSGSRGSALGIESGRYGGEDLAHFMLTVWRPHEDDSLPADERAHLENMFGIALVKNKRFDGKKVTLNMEITEAGKLLDPWEETVIQHRLDQGEF
jgi:hypothetical protein